MKAEYGDYLRGWADAMHVRDIEDARAMMRRTAFWIGLSLIAAVVAGSWVWLGVAAAWVYLLAWSFREWRTLTRPNDREEGKP